MLGIDHINRTLSVEPPGSATLKINCLGIDIQGTSRFKQVSHFIFIIKTLLL